MALSPCVIRSLHATIVFYYNRFLHRTPLLHDMNIGERYMHGLINYIDTKAKCRHLKN
jgi:hypothetical protein